MVAGEGPPPPLQLYLRVRVPPHQQTCSPHHPLLLFLFLHALPVTTPPLPSSQPSRLRFPSLFSSRRERIGWTAGISLPNRWAFSWRWQRLKRWLGKEHGEDERRPARNRKRKKESWREKGEKSSSPRLCQRSYALVQH